MTRAVDEIKYRLCDELSEFAEKKQWSDRDIELIDKITHSIKSLMKYLEMEENGFEDTRSYRGNRSYRMDRYDDGRSYNRRYDDSRYYDDRSYNDSYERGRSRDDGMQKMTEELEEMLENTNDTEVKEAIKKTMAHIKKNK